jgi:succinate dehydrogenase / fumarate reductase cytochrome b subunit
LHRLSGLALIAYLPLHIHVTATLTKGPESFNRTMTFLTSAPFHFLEWGLFGVILYHALNGIRLILVDLGWADSRVGQKRVFWACVAAGSVAWVAWGMVLIGH